MISDDSQNKPVSQKETPSKEWKEFPKDSANLSG